MRPECLDDYLAEDNPVRAVDALIDELDLLALGFAGTEPATTGRPSYHPSILLKLYLYGYLNRIQSSRRLERECQRNIELMWLTGKLTPVCRQFVMLCRRLNLFSQAVVAIDGSKFKAVNAHDRSFTHGKLEKRMQQIDQCIARYLTAMDTADRHQSDVTELKTGRLKEKLATLKKDMAELRVPTNTAVPVAAD